MSTCFFIGHRDTRPDVWGTLVEAVERHIVDYGVDSFTVGCYGGFDYLAGQAVTEAKERYPGITLYLLTPYHPYERLIRLPAGFDGSFYPPGMETVQTVGYRPGKPIYDRKQRPLDRLRPVPRQRQGATGVRPDEGEAGTDTG